MDICRALRVKGGAILIKRDHVKAGKGKASPKSAVTAVGKADCIYLRSKKTVMTPLCRHVRHEGAACVMSKCVLFLFFSLALSPPPSPLLVLFFTFPGNGRNRADLESGSRGSLRTTRRQIHRDRLSRGFTNTTTRATTHFCYFFSLISPTLLIIKTLSRPPTAR